MYRRQAPDDPDFRESGRDAVATKSLPVIIGADIYGSTFPHGTQAVEFEWFVKRAGMSLAGAI